MQKYVVLDKAVGETPLSCMEAWRATQSPALDGVPLTYAGRLDPLASGKLLVLIGDECKRKEQHQALDKAYDFSILFGLTSDSGDVLGLVSSHARSTVPNTSITAALKRCHGRVTFPYPAFSSKPVAGKPLHTWAAEGRLSEITIPTSTTNIFHLSLKQTTVLSRDQVYTEALKKINSIPPVTELRKALGNDFRRGDIREQWQRWRDTTPAQTNFTLAHCRIVCSSGTYVRSVAQHVGTHCGSAALAWSIHRTHLGHYHHWGPVHYWRPSF